MNSNSFQKRSIKFKVGIALIFLFSATIGFFHIGVLYLFGIPIFGLLAGFVLIWFSKKSLKTKILSSLFPIPIIAIFFSLFYLLSPKAEPETVLIPKNFRGQFEIIFNKPCGETLPYENGRRIYKIPDNGILITNSKETFGIINRKFYLVNEKGERNQLPEFSWSNFEDEKANWLWVFSKTKLTKDLVGVFWAYSGRFSFIISDYETLEKEDTETKLNNQENFSRQVNFQLQQCRLKLNR